MISDDHKADAPEVRASRKVAGAASDAVFDSMDIRAVEQFFGKRGLSSETIKALVAKGIELPE